MQIKINISVIQGNTVANIDPSGDHSLGCLQHVLPLGMCGIAFSFIRDSKPEDARVHDIIQNLEKNIARRGPDSFSIDTVQVRIQVF